MTRRIQYRGDREAEWASYEADTRAIAAAFVSGVNAWVALARERPPEEFVLAGWKPEPWAPEDLLNRTDAFVESGDALDEIVRARLVTAVGLARANVLLASDRPVAVPSGLDVTTISAVIADVIRRAGTPPFFMGLAAPVVVQANAGAASATVDEIARRLDHPSPRYLVHLTAPGWNVIGATAPWRPGVAVGHNDRVAWDAAGLDADTQDVFVEKLNPANLHQVEDQGRWVETTRITMPIVIRGNPKPFLFESEFTRRGAVVASDRARHLAFTVRWSGAEPGAAGDLAALGLDRATSWPAFAAAVARWKMPARRFTYADADGRRESLSAALVPVRRGWNGALPAPGWTGAFEWTGWQDADLATAPATPPAVSAVVRFARAHPDRADLLFRALADAASARDSLNVQRARIDDALAGALRADDPGGAVLFAHPLAISPAARRRFNIGPLTPSRDAGPPFAIASHPADWDRSTAVSAPGQSAWTARIRGSRGAEPPVNTPARVHRRRGAGGAE
jgi:penicillin amidase